ncbi:MAG: VWA domain-containing protein [Candidatus Sulfotelmatobacter sp.]
MTNQASLRVFLLFLLSHFLLSHGAVGQVMSIPSSNVGGLRDMPGSLGLTSKAQFMNDLWAISSLHSPLEALSGSLSNLDLKAPGKARREFNKGYRLLARKDFQNAVQPLTLAIAIYPNFVAAHNALGTVYMAVDRNDQARSEFAQAIALDDHLPASYLNLGCAELALKHFSAAEEAIQKASDRAPLDLQLLLALAYGQLMNHDYAGALATARQVHQRKHEGAATVHFFAAAASYAQNNLPQARQELLTLLREDPNSPAALQTVQILEDMKQDQTRPTSDPVSNISFTWDASKAPSGPVQLPEHVRQLLQDAKENSQIADAEAESECAACATSASPVAPASAVANNGEANPSRTHRSHYAGLTLHSSTDEVALFFAATDHGKPVTNLTIKDIDVHDDHKLPASLIALRNESQLPLRLGLVIDTSASVEGRFKFEQESATRFLQKVLTAPDDLAFVIGFANSVLLAQDFTTHQELISHAVSELAPSGGTALWDAVAFAADKLAGHAESQPVARVLVVISDGEDNSSSATLKEAIRQAQRGEIAVYTVSTRENFAGSAIQAPREESLVGEHALNTLAELTGGVALSPGSAHGLNASLGELQRVIRSRYLVSYKPALFARNGQYRAVDIAAQKDGHKLRVYARKGYYAAISPSSTNRF